MNIQLHTNNSTDLSALHGEYDDTIENIQSILNDICDAMAENSDNEFEVGGFGEENWPVDIRTDLPIFLEQLPEIINSVIAHSEFVIDFYEQGIQRKVVFQPTTEGYCVKCESFTAWKPKPNSIQISAVDVHHMLFTFRTNFLEFVNSKAPRLANHPWFLRWAELQPGARH